MWTGCSLPLDAMCTLAEPADAQLGKKEGFLFQSFPILFTFRTGPGDYEAIIPSTLILAQTLVTIHFLFPSSRSVFPKPNSAPTIIIKRASGQVTEARGDRAAIWGSLRVAAQRPPQVF